MVTFWLMMIISICLVNGNYGQWVSKSARDRILNLVRNIMCRLQTLCRNFFTPVSNNCWKRLLLFYPGNPVLKENFSFFRKTFTIYKVWKVDEIEKGRWNRKQNKGLEKPFRHWLWTVGHVRVIVTCKCTSTSTSVLDAGHLPRLQELAGELYQSVSFHTSSQKGPVVCTQRGTTVPSYQSTKHCPQWPAQGPRFLTIAFVWKGQISQIMWIISEVW